MVNKYYMYVLLCGDNSLYGGFTNDLNKRLLKHQSGNGAKYTRSHLPVKMIYHESFEHKRDALKAEYAFKHQSRYQKIQYLINNGVSKNLFQ
ncbi:GIY-YIG nuclease family protein [Apilactobacillus quenuiae]|uniref:GIY-YIG nuclease family protein n=1 Tax=Apilactobacillus quenuiae TaxID=2008377 RepID=UPI000D016533|nr:GIY-YIG nuclease family protein [Apilactobacillus quenuiae]